jgi:hypothetical protein
MAGCFRIMVAVVLSVAYASSAAAQVVSLGSGGSDQVWSSPGAGTFVGQWLD